jgi:hypothetical protein
MKKETFNEDLEVMVTSEEEITGRDENATDSDADGNDGEEGDDESGRPNRGAGSAGPKNPIGGGNRGQYSLRNDNDE